MQARLLLLALVIISAISLSSCASTAPQTEFAPVYRTRQDGKQGGDVYNHNSADGYKRNGKRDGNTGLGGGR